MFNSFTHQTCSSVSLHTPSVRPQSDHAALSQPGSRPDRNQLYTAKFLQIERSTINISENSCKPRQRKNKSTIFFTATKTRNLKVQYCSVFKTAKIKKVIWRSSIYQLHFNTSDDKDDAEKETKVLKNMKSLKKKKTNKRDGLTQAIRDILLTSMARYSLFVLKVLLNTKQTIKVRYISARYC